MQTAVNWLIDQIADKENQEKLTGREWLEVVERAKEMEKEQLNRACYDGYYQEERCDVREYYDETYGKEGSGIWGKPKQTYSKETYSKTDAIEFHRWMLENDTESKAEQYFGYSDEDMYNAFLNK